MIRFHRSHPLKPFSALAPKAPDSAAQPAAARVQAAPSPQPVTAAAAPAPAESRPAAPSRSFGSARMGMASLLASPTKAKTQQPVETSATTAPAGEQPVDKEQLGSAWVGFKEQIPDRARLHFHFDTLPELTGNEVHVQVKSPMFYEDMQDLRPRLQSYLQQRLSHPGLKVVVDLVVPEGAGRTLTDKEKIQEMAAKNGAVKDLYKRLNLRFE
ncbi:MAG: hypothetical protein J6Z12_05175 [Paludibacteraceae bacterium]|nr:hypothetical protein [Paludibacteraceae bacterium]